MDDFTYVLDSSEQPEEPVLVGRGNGIVRISADHWKTHVASATARISARLGFMTPEHHLVRQFAVLEIARQSRPLTEPGISRHLKLSKDLVHRIVGQLERRLFFLSRDSRGAVTWAYPFTADRTPHRVLRKSRRPAWAA